MKRVIVESPYSGDVEANEIYGRECLADCLKRDEAPFASHLLYTQKGVLDDTKPEERRKGIDAGFAWRGFADATVVYLDRGLTEGMIEGINHSKELGVPVETRSIRSKVVAPGWIHEIPKPKGFFNAIKKIWKGKTNGRK